MVFVLVSRIFVGFSIFRVPCCKNRFRSVEFPRVSRIASVKYSIQRLMYSDAGATKE